VFIESLDLDARFLGFHPHTSAVAEKRDHPDAIGEAVVPFGDLPKPPPHFCAGHLISGTSDEPRVLDRLLAVGRRWEVSMEGI
jgi:hypothetical protein